MTRWTVVGVVAIAVVLGCGDDSESSSSNPGGNGGEATVGGSGGSGGSVGGAGGSVGGGGAGGAGGAAMAIPDCGPGMDVWVDPDSFFNGGTGPDYGTPETAWQVGTATQSNPYVQGNVGASGNAFFVFCAGPALTEINIFLNDLDGSGFTQIHIHDGSNSVFGPEVPPTSSSPIGGTWPLTPGQTYVLEIGNDPDAFF